MKRIILFNNDAWTTWKHRKGIIRFLEDNGMDVVVLAGEDQKYSSLLKSNFNYFPLKNMHTIGMNPFRENKLYQEIKSVYKKVNPDMVMHYTMKPNIYGGMICGNMGIPYISTVNGLGRTFLNKGLVYRMMVSLLRKGLKNAEKVFFQNTDDQEFFESIKIIPSQKSVRVMGSGVNMEEWESEIKFSPAGNRQFLLAARLIPEKGVLDFIEAAKQVKVQFPRSIFRIVGPVVDSRISLSILQSLDTQGIISFGGETDDMIAEFSKSDVVVLPTYYREGIPKVLIEALACGKPVITTNFTGAKETVISGENGILIPPRQVEELKQAIELMLTLDTSKLMEMGQSSRNLAQKTFDEKNIYKQYLQTIESILNF